MVTPRVGGASSFIARRIPGLEAGVVLEHGARKLWPLQCWRRTAWLDWLECRVEQVEIKGLRIAYERAGAGAAASPAAGLRG